MGNFHSNDVSDNYSDLKKWNDFEILLIDVMFYVSHVQVFKLLI